MDYLQRQAFSKIRMPSAEIPDKLFRQQIRHHRLFLFQLVDRRIDLCATKLVHRHALYYFDFFPIAADGKRADKPFFHSIAAVRTKTNAVPIARLRWLEN